MRSEYLVEVPAEEREPEAVQRLVSMPFLSEPLFASLGLMPAFSWYVLQLRTDRLVQNFKGDIDILAGKLSWSDPAAFEALVEEERRQRPHSHPSWHYDIAARKLASSGGIRWPPAMSLLVGIEAKCAYRAATIKSAKSSREKVQRMRLELQKLLRIGCDRVALLDIIANPLTSGSDGQAWLAAASGASISLDMMTKVLQERLPQETQVGHWVWLSGSVAGGDETVRGAGATLKLREAGDNPLLQMDPETQTRRRAMEGKLVEILGSFARPSRFSVILLDCRTCGTIHDADETCGELE